MDSKQIDRAMRLGQQVIYKGVRYSRIIEQVYWYDHLGRRRCSVVLLDKNGRSLVKADAKFVDLWDTILL